MLGLGDLKPPVVVVLSGGNIDPLLLLRVIRFGLSASGRYFAFRTRISDRPGALHRLLGLLAELETNVVGIEHHREGARRPRRCRGSAPGRDEGPRTHPGVDGPLEDCRIRHRKAVTKHLPAR